MAKINIYFYDKNYNVDDSAISSASDALKSHLSTVMNGSGATINFGGSAYGIDSTKLTAATNGFISHLGTIAGSGSSVVVNGVSYGIDSSKLSDAIAELHEVLGGLHSGGGNGDSSNLEVILAEQTISGFADAGYGLYLAEAELSFTLEQDVTYKVVWDGIEYICKLIEDELFGWILYDETSFMISAPADDNPIVGFLTKSTSPTHTVAIYKTSEDGGETLIPSIVWGGKYSATITGGDGTTFKEGIVFYEDGSVDYYVNDVYRAHDESGTCKYEVNEDGTTTILWLNDGVYSSDGGYVTADGKNIIYEGEDGVVYTLESSSTPSLNEYGFYYGAPYSFTSDDGAKHTFTFFEDGSFIVKHDFDGEVTEETIPAGTAVYDQNKITINGEVTTVVDNGTKIVFEDGTILVLQSNTPTMNEY